MLNINLYNEEKDKIVILINEINDLIVDIKTKIGKAKFTPGISVLITGLTCICGTLSVGFLFTLSTPTLFAIIGAGIFSFGVSLGAINIINQLIIYNKNLKLTKIVNILEEIRNKLVKLQGIHGDIKLQISDLKVKKDFVNNYDLLLSLFRELIKVATERIEI